MHFMFEDVLEEAHAEFLGHVLRVGEGQIRALGFGRRRTAEKKGGERRGGRRVEVFVEERPVRDQHVLAGSRGHLDIDLEVQRGDVLRHHVLRDLFVARVCGLVLDHLVLLMIWEVQ